MFPRAKVFGHTDDKAIGVENCFEFSIDISKYYPLEMDKIVEEVKTAMYTLQKD